MRFEFNPMDRATAERMIRWRYAPPYDQYNVDADDIDEELAFFTDPANAYYALTTEHGDLVAFCCFGDDARVAGGYYEDEDGVLDVGMGVRPDLTGKGQGHLYISVVLDFARKQFNVQVFRATIAAFNMRALRLCHKAGFETVGTFQRPKDGQTFAILMTKEQ